MGVRHFKILFEAPASTFIAEVIRMDGFFSRFIDQEGNNSLMKQVSDADLLATLKTFQHDKSPGPDGWPVEFYIAFYDFIGGDLLKVVEES